MLIVETLPMVRQQLCRWRQEGKRIGLVPTMGNLHDGHIKLLDEAKTRSDEVVVSIFVNPMQFDRLDDLQRYPRTLQDDCELLNRHSASLVFAPSVEEIYPFDIANQTYVEVPGLSSMLEGASRPGHFRGVSTIVSKLFNLIQPDVACFGEKDFQQLAIIRKMVTDMGYDIDIVGVPVVRTAEGLALSSRNNYLTSAELDIAPALYKTLLGVADRLRAGDRAINEMLAAAADRLNKAGMQAGDLQIRDADTLQMLTAQSQRAVILMAAWLGKARLIDNMQVDLTQ